MENDKILSELVAMQRDLRDAKKSLSTAQAKVNMTIYRVNTLKRRISAPLRGAKAKDGMTCRTGENNAADDE